MLITRVEFSDDSEPYGHGMHAQWAKGGLKNGVRQDNEEHEPHELK